MASGGWKWMVAGKWINEAGNWCNLCKMPFTSWPEHMRTGRFCDHICLEMVYDAIVKQEVRHWSPRGVYASVGLMGNNMSSLVSMHGIFESHEHDNKRNLHNVIKNLCISGNLKSLEKGPIPVWGPNNVEHMIIAKMAVTGGRVMPYIMSKPVVTLFPKADCGQLSQFHTMCVDPYNLESVYDGLNMKDFAFRTWNKDHRSKMSFMRCVVGELYDMTTKFTGSCRDVPFPTRALAQYALRAVIAEIILTKMTEYSIRAENVWREQNCETIESTVFSTADSSHQAKVTKGMFKKVFLPPSGDTHTSEMAFNSRLSPRTIRLQKEEARTATLKSTGRAFVTKSKVRNLAKKKAKLKKEAKK